MEKRSKNWGNIDEKLFLEKKRMRNSIGERRKWRNSDEKVR